MRERKFRELFAPQTQKINNLGYQDICNVKFVVYIEKHGIILIIHGNLESWINNVVIIYFLTRDTDNSLDFLVSDSRTIVKINWKMWGRKAVIAQNEEQFEIFLDELRKTTNGHSIIDVGRYWNRTNHNIFYECHGFANCLVASHVFKDEKKRMQES
jgi:hypothetical protein